MFDRTMYDNFVYDRFRYDIPTELTTQDYIISIPIVLGIYFLPSIIALLRKHTNKWVIVTANLPLYMVYNLTAGLGGIACWIALIIWAFRSDEREIITPRMKELAHAVWTDLKDRRKN